MPSIKDILELINSVGKIEQGIEEIIKSIKTEIDKVHDVKKRKKLHEAFDNRDADALRSAWFDM